MKKGILWLSLATLLFVVALCFWFRRGSAARQDESAQFPKKGFTPFAAKEALPAPATNFPLFSQIGILNGAATAMPVPQHARTNSRFAHRLSNTGLSVGQLARKDNAILLENALLDTGKPLNLQIPKELRAQSDPGSYIVQSKGPLDDPFRAKLSRVGATIVSYIPNNAYLVRASTGVAQGLASSPQVQIVLPYEPYFKLKSGLLNLALNEMPLSQDAILNLAVFPDAKEDTVSNLEKLGAQVVGEELSPFGPVLKVQFNGARPPRSRRLSESPAAA